MIFGLLGFINPRHSLAPRSKKCLCWGTIVYYFPLWGASAFFWGGDNAVSLKGRVDGWVINITNPNNMLWVFGKSRKNLPIHFITINFDFTPSTWLASNDPCSRFTRWAPTSYKWNLTAVISPYYNNWFGPEACPRFFGACPPSFHLHLPRDVTNRAFWMKPAGSQAYKGAMAPAWGPSVSRLEPS